MDTFDELKSTIAYSKNLIIHSDRDNQYNSIKYKNMLKKYNVIQSTSRLGNSLDNRPAEYFFSIIKSECYKLIPWEKKLENNIVKSFDKYIKFYNEERRQTTLDNQSPIQFRKNKK